VIRAVLVVASLSAFAACASTTLPYKPEQQPSGARVSAAYQVVGDRLRIQIDTDGLRLEEAKLLRPDGNELHPQTIEHAPLAYGGYPGGVGVGVGVGGGGWGRRSGVGVGTGVGVSVPVGGSSRVEGTTFAYYPLDQAGPAPWRVRMKLEGIEPVVIVVGGTPADAK
jgi:hypothetical protein